ncbi:SDR family oxidoreductase [Lederbergia lenta]|uniref:Short-chain dehydrogenase/reductase SDR n=1 Tax=Lederbergia lenta TaxID=1467 RepID=A0A2X4VXZ6_LEDLE|nr:SDR family oxidoreductase [Lederbergia lenta]MCM3112706.1 SDR family oxidoreductase [Lederbergia lenta]MEC2323746.1 SDR family oxidoreductase [Lederbergia lenta]SQI51522.1 short-chain dehydrogenase/reductase SDR [Lederbergia lenta]
MYPSYPYYAVKTQCKEQPISFPYQHQSQQPGIESLMTPKPMIENPDYKGSDKLKNKVAIITGGDSGIGAAAAIAFAKEGANLVIPYFSNYEYDDAMRTKRRIEEIGKKCLLMTGDLRDPEHCKSVVQQTIENFGQLNILVNNHGVQFPQKSLLDISVEQWDATFKTNIYAFFYMTKAALPYLIKGDAIINTASVVAYEGNKQLIDYSATKGAIVGFTRALSQNLADQDIRVNAVAPGPIWTPLIPSSFSAEDVETFGLDVPMKRAGQPFELAPAYVYLSSDDSRYVTGQVIHVNGGTMVSS